MSPKNDVNLQLICIRLYIFCMQPNAAQIMFFLPNINIENIEQRSFSLVKILKTLLEVRDGTH